MGVIEITLIGIGLAMDAFAVSVCKGLAMKNANYKKTLIISLYFSVFQAIMPVIGFLIGTKFNRTVEAINHWVAFILLVIIGINMIKDSFDDDKEKTNDSTDVKTMLLLAIATSIDALTVGITFAFLDINIMLAISIIGLITFSLCFIGVKVGNKFGGELQNKAGILGGIILILIGIKTLIIH